MADNGTFIEEVKIQLEKGKLTTKQAQVLSLRAQIKILVRLDDLNENYMVAIGIFVKKHPKIATAIGGLILIAVNMWFIPGPRRAILGLFGLPEEIADFLDS